MCRRADIRVRSNVKQGVGLRGRRVFKAEACFGGRCGQECPRAGRWPRRRRQSLP